MGCYWAGNITESIFVFSLCTVLFIFNIFFTHNALYHNFTMRKNDPRLKNKTIEGSPYLVCNDRNVFFTSEKPRKYHAWSCQNVCDVLTFLLENIFIRLAASCVDK